MAEHTMVLNLNAYSMTCRMGGRSADVQPWLPYSLIRSVQCNSSALQQFLAAWRGWIGVYCRENLEYQTLA
jgi:hypothetical protein